MNTHRTLFNASFLTLIVAGMGFGVRAKVLGDWAAEYGFTKIQLGQITGMGLTGFGVTIIICSLFIDRVGYKPLMVVAFVLHALSVLVTSIAAPVYAAFGADGAYWVLFIGTTMFALANGICEAVINPLVATLYPTQKTHYLNILHAGWPGGLILGGIVAYLFVGSEAQFAQMRWEIAIGLYLIPTIIYGAMMIRHQFPISEAKAAGVGFGTMVREFAAPILLLLLVLHAMVGYVELGTDSWVVNIMNNVIQGKATLLFIYTSALMFVLRFFAGPIVKRINPIGLLALSALLGSIGLYWLGNAELGLSVFLAGTIYGVGKTFLWPTMLGVVAERFPKGGALTLGTVGAMGALSAGILGGPMIGYKQDYYASKELKRQSEPLYEQYAADKPNKVLFLPSISGLDGARTGPIKQKAGNVANKKAAGEAITDAEQLTSEEQKVFDADLYGGRMALQLTALVPLAMAVLYGLLWVYFRTTGGYQAEHLEAIGEPESRPGDSDTSSTAAAEPPAPGTPDG